MCPACKARLRTRAVLQMEKAKCGQTWQAHIKTQQDREEKRSQRYKWLSKHIASPCSTAGGQPSWHRGLGKMLCTRKAARGWEQTIAPSLVYEQNTRHRCNEIIDRLSTNTVRPAQNPPFGVSSLLKQGLFGVRWKIAGAKEAVHTEITYSACSGQIAPAEMQT